MPQGKNFLPLLGIAVKQPARPCVKAKARFVAKLQPKSSERAICGKKGLQGSTFQMFFFVKFCLRFSYVSYVKSNFLVSHFFLDLNFYQLQLLREVLDWVDLEFTETAFRPGQADIVMMSDVSPHQKSDVKVMKVTEKKDAEVGLSSFFLVFGISMKLSPLKDAVCSPKLRNSQLL